MKLCRFQARCATGSNPDDPIAQSSRVLRRANWCRQSSVLLRGQSARNLLGHRMSSGLLLTHLRVGSSLLSLGEVLAFEAVPTWSTSGVQLADLRAVAFHLTETGYSRLLLRPLGTQSDAGDLFGRHGQRPTLALVELVHQAVVLLAQADEVSQPLVAEADVGVVVNMQARGRATVGHLAPSTVATPVRQSLASPRARADVGVVASASVGGVLGPVAIGHGGEPSTF